MRTSQYIRQITEKGLQWVFSFLIGKINVITEHFVLGTQLIIYFTLLLIFNSYLTEITSSFVARRSGLVLD